MTLKEQNAKISVEITKFEEKQLTFNELGVQLKERERMIHELENNLTTLQGVHLESQGRSDTLAKKYDFELKKMRSELSAFKEK